MSSIVNYIETSNSVVVVLGSGANVKNIQIPKESPLFDEVIEALDAGQFDNVEQLLDIASKITRDSSGKFQVVDGQIFTDGELLPKALSDRVLTFANEKLDYSPLIKFWNRLRNNPSKGSKDSLYDFLEKNHVPINQDGMLIMYKGVRNDYTDWHSGKFSNKVGVRHTMPRNNVCDNRNIGCSHGFHASTVGFAIGYANGGHLMKVLVDPKDVVSVPNEGNFEKVRVCEYVVVDEIPWSQGQHLPNVPHVEYYGEDDDDFFEDEDIPICEYCSEYEDECMCDFCSDCLEKMPECCCDEEESEKIDTETYIVDRYADGASMCELAKEHGMSRHSIKKILEENGVKLRFHPNQYS